VRSSVGVVVGETERECVVCGECHLGRGISNALPRNYKGGCGQKGSWPYPGRF